MIIYFNTPTCFGPSAIFRVTIKYNENILDTITYPADNKRKKEINIIYETSWCDYLLTYSMVQSPAWEASWFAASQEIPRLLWNPKVHYRIHKLPPPVPILG